jgi:cyclophilin family peptidyl-prolyl cis-trans isomerase
VARLSHPHPYVRVTAATALGDRFALAAADSAARALVVDSLTAHLSDRDAATRAAAARSLLAIRGAAALPAVDPLLRDTSIVTRTGAIDALRARALERSQLDLLAPRLDPKATLAERLTAADVIGARRESQGAALLRAGLADSSMLFVAACASGLAEMKDSSSVSALAAAYARRAADVETDARIAIHDALRELVSAVFADSVAKAHPARDAVPKYPDDFAEPPKEHGAVLHTSKGDIEWSFYGHEAPQTVKNFVRLARHGYFDGDLFHRVVPNFVIQDGDPTGTGSGGPGYTIRCEYNHLHYAPGMVGMALSGKDTGGSQWFITHSPQPHLDGRYTIFAHVTRGMDVVHRIVQGDRLLRVDILE